MTAAPGLSAAKRAAMTRLAEVLEETSYAQLYGAVAGAGLFVADRARAVRLSDTLPGEARAVVRLLALDEPVTRGGTSSRLTQLGDALLNAGLARLEGDLLGLDDLVVVPVLGGHLLTATPPGWRPGQHRSGRAYLGEDSLRLARALPRCEGKAVLDLGAGCGVQGLLAARGARRVVLTDIEERSLELAALNAVLNSSSGAVEVVAGDCYEPVAAERFDLVVTLPPYLPSLPTTEQSAVSAGPDGLGLLRRIVAEAAGHLAPGGELVSLVQLLCDDDGPLLADELPELAPELEARLVCSEWHPLQPYALELATKLAGLLGTDLRATLGQFLASLRSRGATGVCTAFLRLRATARPDRVGRVEVAALERWWPRTVLAPAPGLAVAGEAGPGRVLTADGSSHNLPAHVVALLAAFDGVRDLEDVAAVAWGRPEGAEPADLLDQAIERAGELERAGLLELVRA